MLFNSYAFIGVFLPLVLIGFFWLGGRSNRLAALWLALASLVFYGLVGMDCLALLLASVSFNYGAGRVLGRMRERRQTARSGTVLAAAVGVNLLLLGCFKYANFFIDVSNGWLGTEYGFLNVALPLGISFYTFTQIAFLVDVRRGLAREYDPVHYLLLVTYFPHLMAGPLLHHRQIMGQLNDPGIYRKDWGNMAAGLTIFIVGLAKKVIVADGLAQYADPLFDLVAGGARLSFFEAWLAVLLFAFQLYFDFSGYTDMAIGISLMFNIRLPMNFHSPLKAASMVEFWQRWHMTLTRFFQNYVFIPLVFNSRGPRGLRQFGALLVTLLLVGFWHGAGWNFVVWGGLHACFLLINHAWRRLAPRCRLPVPLAIALTFTTLVVSLSLFRTATLGEALSITKGLFGFHGISLPPLWQPARDMLVAIFPEGSLRFDGFVPYFFGNLPLCIFYLLLSMTIVWIFPSLRQVMAVSRPTWEDWTGQTLPAEGRAFLPVGFWRANSRQAWMLGTVFGFCMISLLTSAEFIYFRF